MKIYIGLMALMLLGVACVQSTMYGSSFDLGNYTVSIPFIALISPQYHSAEKANVTTNYVDFELGAFGGMEGGNRIVVIENTAPIYNTSNRNVIGPLLMATVTVVIRDNYEENMTRNAGYTVVSRPYPGAVVSDTLSKNNTKVNAYVAPLNDHALLVVVSSISATYFTSLIEGLNATRKEQEPARRAEGIAEVLNG
jgi:hypothetical protein